jgi:hypothetical protein
MDDNTLGPVVLENKVRLTSHSNLYSLAGIL